MDPSFKNGLLVVLISVALLFSQVLSNTRSKEAEDNLCEIKATRACERHNMDMLEAVESSTVTRICEVYKQYHSCLWSEGEYCWKDFIPKVLTGACSRYGSNRCTTCSGTGDVTPSVLSMAAIGLIGYVCLKFGF